MTVHFDVFSRRARLLQAFSVKLREGESQPETGGLLMQAAHLGPTANLKLEAAGTVCYARHTVLYLHGIVLLAGYASRPALTAAFYVSSPNSATLAALLAPPSPNTLAPSLRLPRFHPARAPPPPAATVDAAAVSQPPPSSSSSSTSSSPPPTPRASTEPIASCCCCCLKETLPLLLLLLLLPAPATTACTCGGREGRAKVRAPVSAGWDWCRASPDTGVGARLTEGKDGPPPPAAAATAAAAAAIACRCSSVSTYLGHKHGGRGKLFNAVESL
jgi:hypothetical protein